MAKITESAAEALTHSKGCVFQINHRLSSEILYLGNGNIKISLMATAEPTRFSCIITGMSSYKGKRALNGHLGTMHSCLKEVQYHKPSRINVVGNENTNPSLNASLKLYSGLLENSYLTYSTCPIHKGYNMS